MNNSLDTIAFILLPIIITFIILHGEYLMRLNPDCTCNYGDHAHTTCPSCEIANLEAVEQAEQTELDIEREHAEATDLIYYPTYQVR